MVSLHRPVLKAHTRWTRLSLHEYFEAVLLVSGSLFGGLPAAGDVSNDLVGPDAGGVIMDAADDHQLISFG